MSQELTKSGGQLIKNLLEERKGDFAKALQNNIDPSHFIRAALTMVQENSKLMECSQASLYSALLKSAQLSLSPDGILGQAYLVPYAGKAQLIIGYKGLRELALRTNKYKDVRARVVYANDHFKIQYGSEEVIEHIPHEGERGEMRGAYAVAITMDGTALPEFMWAKEIEDHKEQYSKGWKKSDSMWQTAPARAWEKTVIRRLCGRLQMSVVAQGVLAREDRINADLPLPDEGLGEIIDIETEEETDDSDNPENDGSGNSNSKGIGGLTETVKKKNGGKKTGKEKVSPPEEVEETEEDSLRVKIYERVLLNHPKVYWKDVIHDLGLQYFGKGEIDPKTEYAYDLYKMDLSKLKILWAHLQAEKKD